MVKNNELDPSDYYQDEEDFNQEVEDGTTPFTNYNDYTDAVDLDVEVDPDFYRDNR
ncbi:hypothetical protein JHD46_05165 [Sulfurimonas sp. SAG-AH-194-C20]|nr:hypothetical protein [Sulfurimonas sp. SAG-AH-194-C20]MDF1879028.1 hypothetical protein [Sulfurimonas sp. SAG-AH-194-C20]